MAASEQVGVGIIGGGMGRTHARNFKKMTSARLLAIAGPDVERCTEVAHENGIPDVYADYHEMLARPDIEAVTVAVPNFLHRPILLDCLAAGKHVMIEKPLAHNVADGEAIVAAAAASKTVVMMAFNNRFNGGSQVLKEQIGAGVLGDIYYAKARWLRREGIPGFGGWFTTKARSGGGPLIDIGVHVLDLALYLMGYPTVKAVFGATYAVFGPRGRGAMPGWRTSDSGPLATYDVEDLATGLITFTNGATLLIEASWASFIAASDDVGVDLLGSEGGAHLTTATNPADKPLTIFTEMNGAQVDVTPWVPAVTGHAAELELFIKAIRDGNPPPSTVGEGLTVLRILDALYTSATTGQAVMLG